MGVNDEYVKFGYGHICVENMLLKFQILSSAMEGKILEFLDDLELELIHNCSLYKCLNIQDYMLNIFKT